MNYVMGNRFMQYTNNRYADQPARSDLHSCMISAFLIYILFTFRLVQPASVAEQTDLSLTWLERPTTGFLVTLLK